ncbi:Mediator complex subunit Med10 [Carpediemonas membranifera]|uniref:Mediator of RNA polymerase II transcription subunit 10 n=1 Tax=Carpediemonas membranifera TaxID=201153 RepID=A0A8J6BEL3_9EUKA|nr:Mediator complex subunit Med10 [Carpediemonas membranifera]|eukprot:KAG9395832.1 Mediator complex subunit Med10 [Carpediemonas membranifera]
MASNEDARLRQRMRQLHRLQQDVENASESAAKVKEFIRSGTTQQMPDGTEATDLQSSVRGFLDTLSTVRRHASSLDRDIPQMSKAMFRSVLGYIDRGEDPDQYMLNQYTEFLRVNMEANGRMEALATLKEAMEEEIKLR